MNHKTTPKTLAILEVEEYSANDEAGAYDAYKEHGLAFDRGAADAWYGRGPDPHYWPEGSYNGTMVEKDQMTLNELDAYYAGYYIHDDDPGYRKQWD